MQLRMSWRSQVPSAVSPCQTSPVRSAALLFALDTSRTKGAIVEFDAMGPELPRALWRHGESRGGYSKMEGAPPD